MRVFPLLFCLIAPSWFATADEEDRLNIVLIVTDDHRYDAMGYMGHPFLQTPNLDMLAAGGVRMDRAYVTTSLCSPSRASIITGLYAHNHGVVDNYNPVSPDLRFFPEWLQEAGYATAFIGKWHMGAVDDPQKGFDHWVSFAGQGVYAPDPGQLRVKGRYVPQANNTGFNVNGERVEQRGYITDELTEYAMDWLETREGASEPFFLYLSHKAAHADFLPANRHAFRYEGMQVKRPPSPQTDPDLYLDPPMWVLNQRNSRHGIDFAYYTELDLAQAYRRYCETLLAVDESVGQMIEALKERGDWERTLMIYMGDNGFLFGEHGLIDKRCAYDPSVRIPLLLHCPRELPSGTVLNSVVGNIDVAPTILEAAGVVAPSGLDGQSFWSLARGDTSVWRDYLLYEYAWERNYPQTPTMHALLGSRYKYIRHHGVWDIDALYDLEADPEERRNLIADPEQAERVAMFNEALFEVLRETGGDALALRPDRGTQFYHRKSDGPRGVDFPDWFYRDADRTGR